MASVIETEITINAPADRVWAVLADLSGYATWNPFIVDAAGRPEAGARVSLRVARADGRRVGFRPVVLMAVAPVQLRWLGRLGPPGLFDAEQGFRLEVPNGRAPVRLIQRVRLEGLLALVRRRSLEPELLERCAAMNEALKRRVEAGPG